MNEKLKKQILKNTQWPIGKRDKQYQSIEEMSGIRDMEHRYGIMRLPRDFGNKNVLDLGCNLGTVCVYSKKANANRVVGIDYKTKTIDTAKDYVLELGLAIGYYTFDINQGLEELKDLIGDEKFHYVFALSIWNHVEHKKIFEIINYFCKEFCWFEGHAKDDSATMHKILKDNLDHKMVEFLGFTTDRNQRPNFLIEKVF